MTQAGLGEGLIAAAALSSILIPVGVDGVLLTRMHMRNPRWLPHAKLHCAMSFFAAAALGAGALALLGTARASDLGAMALAAFLATAFWAGLILAGFWPGASYGFEGDPGFTVAPPVLLGIRLDLNVVVAAAAVLAGWAGFALLWAGRHGNMAL